MKTFTLAILLLVVAGCSIQQYKLYWRAKDFALDRSPMVGLRGRDEQIVWTIPTRTIQEMTLGALAH
jgi:hypothetical protein